MYKILFYFIFSLIIVSFGQPAWIRGLGPLAAAFGFALFWKGSLEIPSFKGRFFLSLVWFSLVQGIQLSWLTTMDYMGPLIIVLYLFLILGMGVQFGLLSFFIGSKMRLSTVLAASGMWTLSEWIRLFFLCGFTWNPVGLSLADSPYSIQFASLGGIYGLSFWVILTNCFALNALSDKTTKKIVQWAVVAFLPYVFGFCQKKWVEANNQSESSLNVALVQTALFPEQKDYHPATSEHYLPPILQWERILDVIDLNKKLDLIVFPEAAFPLGAHMPHYRLGYALDLFGFNSLPKLTKTDVSTNTKEMRVTNAFLLQALSNKTGAHVIAGLDDVDASGKYNAAFHFAPNGSDFERYEKRVLVPVGEYLPLKWWKGFSEFVGKQFQIYSSFDPGTEVKVFQATVPMGISICLEETFSSLTRDLRLAGAKLFVNLTNDVWFPRSKLARQHFDHGRVRAAENGVPILRSCNTGITGGVDCFGSPFELLAQSETEASCLYFEMPLRSYSTLYTFWGDWAILSLSLLFVLNYFFQSRKSCRK